MSKKKSVLQSCIDETNKRQLTLKKYYPFFKMHSLNNSQGNKYKEYEMSSLSLAIMHYLLVEGKLKEMGKSFEEIESFLLEYINKTMKTEFEDGELRGLTKYVLENLNNGDGHAFEYSYFEPKSKVRTTSKIKYIKIAENKKSRGDFLYYLTDEGIDFFLQTKEFGEESKVTIYLLLLQQQLKNSDFEGVYNSVVKINAEVLQQIERKYAVSESLLYAGEEGFKQYKEYCEDVGKRLDDEHDLFSTTYRMVQEVKEEYIKKANVNFSEMKDEEQENIQFLFDTDKELGLTIERHSHLLDEIIALKKDALDIRREKRRKAFKKSFNFERFFNEAVKNNDVLALRGIINPLLKPNIKKRFNPFKIESMFTFNTPNRIDDSIEQMAIDVVEDDIITMEELTNERVIHNYYIYMKTLLFLIKDNPSTTLEDVCRVLLEKYDVNALINAEFSAFVFNLHENRETPVSKPMLNYRLIMEKGMEAKLCEKIYVKIINEESDLSFLKYVTLNIECMSGSYCKLGDYLTITNFKYIR